jgi:hypothetical protein
LEQQLEDSSGLIDALRQLAEQRRRLLTVPVSDSVAQMVHVQSRAPRPSLWRAATPAFAVSPDSQLLWFELPVLSKRACLRLGNNFHAGVMQTCQQRATH